MERLIGKAYGKDVMLIVACIFLIWGTLLFILFKIYQLSMALNIFCAVAVTCVLCLIFLSSALLGVLSHLKKNRVNLYTQQFSLHDPLVENVKGL